MKNVRILFRDDQMSVIDESVKSVVGGPTWEVAHLFPHQGAWSVEDYLQLTTNRLVEFSLGTLEVLALPTEQHQLIVAYLYRIMDEFVRARRLGKVLFAPLRVRLWEGKFREPDIIFLLAENVDLRGNRYWDGANLVVEVVSEDDPDRDWVEKRIEYARAGIEEYWVVDPRDSTLTIMTLPPSTDEYVIDGQFTIADVAQSVLLKGLEVSVKEVFAQD